MDQSPQPRPSVRSIPLRRAIAVAVGVAVLPAAAVAVQAGGATHGRSARSLVISTVETARFGKVLASGHTVYTLRPSGVACGATCLTYWPEVLLPKGVAHATAGAGVNAARLGTLRRAGGALQVTYGGKALYWFSLDRADGQVKGNVSDTWGTWSVVVVKPRTPPSTTTTGRPGVTTTEPAVTTTTTKPPPPTTVPSGGGGGGAGF
jgi:predicted lipoprotein with Yx(FWY)xxD motif